jgi:hypothetical protein
LHWLRRAAETRNSEALPISPYNAPCGQTWPHHQ